MWMVKGALLGLAAFLPLGIGYVFLRVGLPIRRHAATGVMLLRGVTIYSPVFWIWFAVVMTCALCLAHRWWAVA